MPFRRRPTGLLTLTVGGVLLLIGGICLTAWRWAHPAVSGWFAYAPLSSQHVTVTATPDWVEVLGYICSVLGAAITGIASGIQLRRR